jgi:hypothetical protein
LHALPIHALITEGAAAIVRAVIVRATCQVVCAVANRATTLEARRPDLLQAAPASACVEDVAAEHANAVDDEEGCEEDAHQHQHEEGSLGSAQLCLCFFVCLCHNGQDDVLGVHNLQDNSTQYKWLASLSTPTQSRPDVRSVNGAQQKWQPLHDVLG